MDPSKRQSIVNQFNSDPTIDLLLLTTHVGGLGLNLTGADTGNLLKINNNNNLLILNV